MEVTLFEITENEMALVRRAADDPAAFAEIYHCYFLRVYNYVRYRVQNVEVADDITSDVFVRALGRIGAYRPKSVPFSSWLFAIARNAVRDHARCEKRRPCISLETLSEQASSDPLPDEIVAHNLTLDQLRAALRGLSERDREIIALKFGAGLPNHSIAKLMKMTESNVGVIVYRAVRRLRCKLCGEEDEL
jgi:RNA polymerase sigma-70 factor (ECF subfamily)